MKTLVLPIELLQLIAHPNSLRIVDLLLDGEKQVLVITQTLSIRQSDTSLILRKMHFAGLLLLRKEGSYHFYSLAPKMVEVARGLINAVEALCNESQS